MTPLLKSLAVILILLAMPVSGACLQGAQGAAVGQSQQVSPFSLTLSPVQAAIIAGTPSKVKITATSASDQPLHFAYNADNCVSTLNVRDENGNPPPDTALGRAMKYHSGSGSPNRGRGTYLLGSGAQDPILDPGAVFTQTCDLDALYDLSQPGAYTIQATLLAGESSVPAQSNIVTLTVTPNSSKPVVSPAAPQFSLTIIPREPTMSLDSPIPLEIMTKNVSDQRLYLWAEESHHQQAGVTYQISVVDENATAPHDTAFGKAAKARTDIPSASKAPSLSSGSGETLVLRPGESWIDTINIKTLYEIKKPGDYTIQVERFDPATNTMVKSNTITVSVTP